MKNFTGKLSNTDGAVFYYKNGLLHREDGPAIEYPNGGKSWYKNGKLHREDGPAEEYDLHRAWYKNGKLHREDGPAVIKYANDDDGNIEEIYQAWWFNGKKHRLDGPAIEDRLNGGYFYYVNGKEVYSKFTIKNGKLHKPTVFYNGKFLYEKIDDGHKWKLILSKKNKKLKLNTNNKIFNFHPNDACEKIYKCLKCNIHLVLNEDSYIDYYFDNNELKVKHYTNDNIIKCDEYIIEGILK